MTVLQMKYGSYTTLGSYTLVKNPTTYSFSFGGTSSSNTFHLANSATDERSFCGVKRKGDQWYEHTEAAQPGDPTLCERCWTHIAAREGWS